MVTHPSHSFAVRDQASIREVAREPLILYDPGSSYFVLINQVCREAGVTPRVEMNLDSIEATKRMVELGLGVSFLPRSGVRQELENGTLTIIPITEGHLVVLPTCVLIRRAQHYGPTVLAFLELLQQVYEADIPLLQQSGVPEGA